MKVHRIDVAVSDELVSEDGFKSSHYVKLQQNNQDILWTIQKTSKSINSVISEQALFLTQKTNEYTTSEFGESRFPTKAIHIRGLMSAEMHSAWDSSLFLAGSKSDEINSHGGLSINSGVLDILEVHEFPSAGEYIRSKCKNKNLHTLGAMVDNLINTGELRKYDIANMSWTLIPSETIELAGTISPENGDILRKTIDTLIWNGKISEVRLIVNQFKGKSTPDKRIVSLSLLDQCISSLLEFYRLYGVQFPKNKKIEFLKQIINYATTRSDHTLVHLLNIECAYIQKGKEKSIIKPMIFDENSDLGDDIFTLPTLKKQNFDN